MDGYVWQALIKRGDIWRVNVGVLGVPARAFGALSDRQRCLLGERFKYSIRVAFLVELWVCALAET